MKKLVLIACACVLVAGTADARPRHKHRSLTVSTQTNSDDRYANVRPAFPMAPSALDVTRAMRHPAPFTSPSLVQRMRAYIGSNPTGWARVWCGVFLDMALRATGHSPGSPLARSYASYGAPAHGPAPGVIAVWPHHVGVVTAVGSGTVTVISGNDGRRVRERERSTRGVIAWRVPR